MGAQTKFTTELVDRLMAELALKTDREACKAVGISVTTMRVWITRSKEAKIPKYSGFHHRVELARQRREERILTRLPAYKDWRADDAYLKHLSRRRLDEVKRKQARAEARRAEAEAEKAEALAGMAKLQLQAELSREDESELSRLMVPEDLLELIARVDPDAYDRIEVIFTQQGIQPMITSDLGSGVSLRDLENASPSPMPEKV